MKTSTRLVKSGVVRNLSRADHWTLPQSKPAMIIDEAQGMMTMGKFKQRDGLVVRVCPLHKGETCNQTQVVSHQSLKTWYKLESA